MSQETTADLNTNVLIGFTSKRGNAWHYDPKFQGDESNHYEQEVPVDDVYLRLFDWEAVEGQVTATATLPNGDMITSPVSRYKAIMRSDTGKILGIPKDSYRIHQYPEWLVSNVSTLLDANLRIGSAGLLRGGGRAWVQIEMPETMEVAGTGVEYRPFLTAATSLDGSLATTYLTGAQVVVCDNTLSTALNTSDASVKIRHSQNSLNRIQSVREALSLVFATADTFEQEVKDLTSRVVTDDQWEEFVNLYTTGGKEPAPGRSATMAKTKQTELTDLYANDVRVAPWAGSAYGVLAAVNTHVQHVQTVRNVSRAERNYGRMVDGSFNALDQGTLRLLATVTG